MSSKNCEICKKIVTKSQIIQQWAKENNVQVVDIKLTNPKKVIKIKK